MLSEMTVKDYTTFMKETTFDFKATNYKILESTNVGENRILKGALFVGENASGKTQILKAIQLLLDLLIDNKDINIIRKKSLYTKGTTCSFSWTFNIKNNIIKYYIQFETNNIYEEKLFLNEKLMLERLKNTGKTYFVDNEEKNNDDINLSLPLLKLEYYNTRLNNNEILNEWFEYMKNSMTINCMYGYKATKSYNPSKIDEQFINKYAESHDTKELNMFLKKLGYNSELSFEKQTSSIDNSIIIGSNKEFIGLKKKGTSVVMPIDIESNGNQALINSILPFIYATKNNCMLIIDEFSSGLHNDLEEALVRYFFNNSKNSQLFFTSHSTNLLDNSILRPDQIYSFSFDSRKGTIIKRFSDENPRESQNIEKMYLSGVFDGLPKYNKEFKN